MTNFTISRRSLLGGLTAGSALALAGCNSSPDSTSSASPSAGAVVGSDKLTVYAWTNGPVIDANFTKSVEAFNLSLIHI